MKFSQWLQSEMDEKGITKYRLAKMSGVHQTTISNLLTGANPQIETERKIRAALSGLADAQKEKPAPKGGLDLAEFISHMDGLTDDQLLQVLAKVTEALQNKSRPEKDGK